MVNTEQSSGPGTAVLALDQGTTNTKAILLQTDNGRILASASRPVGIAYPRPGWVEQDADQIWTATLAAAQECLGAAGVTPVAVSISNQRESVVCWSRSSGEPLGPVLGWQDARTAAWCADVVRSRPDAPALVRRRTGLSLDPMFSAPKMRAALDAAVAAGADPDDVALGTVDAWLVHRLTGTPATDVGNASRTLLLDLESLDWHPELLELFGLPATALPEVRASDGGFGVTVGAGLLPAGVPVAAVLADSHAALYLHGCTEPGTGKATYGTGSSVMTPLAALGPAPEGIATTVAWQVGGRTTFAREGNIVASGAALDWMAAALGAPAGTAGGAFLTELAEQVEDSGGAAFVPAFSGLGAPYWDRSATGVIAGLTAGTTRAHLARAALEAVAQQVVDVVEAVESDGCVRLAELRADGGATASALLMQIQANLLGRPVRVADTPEASALGAALLAARALGLPVAPMSQGRLVQPSHTDPSSARAAWSAAVSRSRGLAVNPT